MMTTKSHDNIDGKYSVQSHNAIMITEVIKVMATNFANNNDGNEDGQRQNQMANDDSAEDIGDTLQ